MKIFRVLSGTLVLLSGSKMDHGRFNTKNGIETSLWVKKSKVTVKVMTPAERAMEWTRFILGVGEEGSAWGKRDLGVDKRLDGAIDRIGVEIADVIVSRALITSLRNWSGSIPERMSSDKLSRVNARSTTGWKCVWTEGEVVTRGGIVAVVRVVELRD